MSFVSDLLVTNFPIFNAMAPPTPNQISKMKSTILEPRRHGINRLTRMSMNPYASSTYRKLFLKTPPFRATQTIEEKLHLIESAFDELDPQNTTDFQHLSNDRDHLIAFKLPSIVMWLSLIQRLSDSINAKLKQPTYTASTVYALMSFVTSADDESLELLAKSPLINDNQGFCNTIKDCRGFRCRVFVKDVGMVDYLKNSIKIWNKYFGRNSNGISRTPFKLRNFINNYDQFYKHLVGVCSKLLAGTVITSKDLKDPKKYNVCNTRPLKPQSKLLKFITGVACCGKTTLLNALNADGWIIYSRGDLGSFGGKSKSAATIGIMNVTMEYVLRQTDVIGDRGPLDNAIWEFIMNIMSSKQYEDNAEEIVRSLLLFIGTHVNDAAIEALSSHCGVIFLDGDCSQNRQRMIKRGESGDTYRGRLDLYPEMQFIAYYTCALLFKWSIIMVPYNSDGEFAPDQYTNIAEKIDQIMRVNLIPDPVTQMSTKEMYMKLDDEHIEPIRDCYADMIGIRR